MRATLNKERTFWLLDSIVGRWVAKEFPYNKKDAVIPQTLIPSELRDNQYALACFYLYICIYMRGGIESSQAFRAMLRLWQERPQLFNPRYAETLEPAELAPILKTYVGWDSKAASINWVENSRRLVRTWRADPRNLIKELHDYDEAMRRMRNKFSMREIREAGHNGAGFRGFQPKMVSMLVYFYDWEGWTAKFLYPAPADFHNFRLAFATGSLTVTGEPEYIRPDENVSAMWRDVLMQYLRERNYTPLEVADALWLFSLVMCGNSPLTMTKNLDIPEDPRKPLMFANDDVPRKLSENFYESPRYDDALERTCLRCAISEHCTLAIPSRPYYTKGQMVLRPRPRIELSRAVPTQQPTETAEQQELSISTGTRCVA